MHQVPVESLEKIRNTRRKVKHILSDIGLEDCQTFLEELQNSGDPVDEDIFLETEWTDFTDGFNRRRRRKWVYRTDTICCSLCEYHTRNWRNFKYHLERNHEYERSACALSPCPHCPFIGHPKVVRKHVWLFHSNSNPSSAPTSTRTEGFTEIPKKGERYQCRKCSFQSSVLFALKKHVLLAHLGNLRILSQFTRRNPDPQLSGTLQYHCKDCDVSLENLDYMLHHILVTPAHRSVTWHVRPFIAENKNYNVVASKTQQPEVLSGQLLAPSANDQQAGKVLPVQQHGAIGSFTRAPGTNQILLPPQASALVQLAGAEAKGLLKPGAAITFQSALPPGVVPTTMSLPGGIGPAMVRITTPSNSVSKQLQQTFGQKPLQSWPQQVLLPNGSMPRLDGTGPHPLTATPKPPLNQTTPQGTMLTSQSLLSHLIPTGNKINGVPTYTFAQLKMTVPVNKETSQNTASPLQPMKPRGNHLPEAKRWVACPICSELFPSDVYELHTEVVHKATSKHECLAAKTPFLRKMPDKTVKCLMCKVLVSEKGLLEHLLHGLDCIFCPAKFNSIKKLLEHSKEHNLSLKAYCDFMRREYRLYTNGAGKLMFPYFDINTSAPKEMLGETELNLALVTKSLDLIFLKMSPSSRHPVCYTPMKTIRTCCLFCEEDCQTPEKYQQHLRQKHFVDTTIHAILKTAAFKCIYCNGLYTGRVSQRGIAVHLQRCQCAPTNTAKASTNTAKAPTITAKAPANTEKLLSNGQVLLATPCNGQTALPPAPKPPIKSSPLCYFAPPPKAPVPSPEPPQSEAEKLSNLRLEMAWKEVMEANRQEREERAARLLRQEQESAALPTSQLEIQIDPTVKLALDPGGPEKRSAEELKDFLTRYFHKRPYLTKKESDELSRRLSLQKSEVAMLFSHKRTKCIKTMGRNTAAVLLGFNMSELNKVKHNLLIPEVASAVTEEKGQLAQSEDIKEEGNLDVSRDVENMEESATTICQQGAMEDELEVVEAHSNTEEMEELTITTTKGKINLG